MLGNFFLKYTREGNFVTPYFLAYLGSLILIKVISKLSVSVSIFSSPFNTSGQVLHSSASKIRIKKSLRKLKMLQTASTIRFYIPMLMLEDFKGKNAH